MNQSVPSRHPRSPRPVPAMVGALVQVLALRKPNTAQWRRLGERLNAGDEPVDRLVEWMAAAGMSEARSLFDRALAEGIANVPEAPEPLREFFSRVESIPDWVDLEKVRRGQRALRRGGADGAYIARDVALLGGYQFSGFNQTLLRTGALEKGSNKRFAETLQWAMDVIVDGGLVPGGVGFRSTVRVRLIHALVRRYVSGLPDWRPEEWGLPVNQTDMAATLVGALIAPPAAGLGMGIVSAPADLDAVAHMTRYVGWLIGVEDEWLPTSFRDGVRVLYHTLTALGTPDETTRQLSVPMADDPLSWNYTSVPALRRRLARVQHLSVTSAFLGPRGMRMLGLPAYIPPVYPLLRMPVNLARSAAALCLPGGMDRAAARGFREQRDWLHTMTGETSATIGESATTVSGAA